HDGLTDRACMSPTRFADVNASSSAVFKETNFMSTVSRGSSALRPGDLYTPRSQCCPSSLVHADHSAWAKSVVELGLLLAALTHLCETWPLSQTRDRSRLSLRRPLPSLWWKRLWSSPRHATLWP